MRLTPETKDFIKKDVLMKVPKSTTLINAARQERVHAGERCLRFSAREQTSITTPMYQRVTTLT